MLLTNPKKLYKKAVAYLGLTMKEAAARAGMRPQNVWRCVSEYHVVNHTYIKVVEALGFDVQLTLVKRSINNDKL